MNIKYSISTWNYLKAFGAEAQLYRVLNRLREQGYGMELWLDWTPEPELFERKNWPRLKELCTDAAALSAHTRLIHHFNLEILMEEIDLCRYLRANPLVIHPRSLDFQVSTWDAVWDSEGIKNVHQDLLQRILEYSGERSVCLALENGPLNLLQQVIRECRDYPGAEFLGFCVDTGHANLHREMYRSPAPEYIRTLHDRLFHVHLSDNSGDADEHAVPGSGNIDWLAVMSELIKIAYSGCRVLELQAAHPDQAAGATIAFLETMQG
jgi:sugar phosphate isomerase/epimerase